MKKIENYLRFFRNYFVVSMIGLFVFRKMKKKKYYVSICGIFKDEGKYLKEWIDYHIASGVCHFYLYNNFSSDNYLDVLKPYIEKEIVTLKDWAVTSGQMSAYNDCIENFSDESNWIGFIDLDEYVCPIKYDGIDSWLKKYEKFPCVSAFWRMFSSSGIMKEDLSKTIIEQFVVCSDIKTSSKMFLNTNWSKKIKKFTMPHYCRFKFLNLVFPENAKLFFKIVSTIETSDVQINHYFCKSYEYFVKNKMIRGDADKEGGFRRLNEFFGIENICDKTDYSIFKYLIKLKTFDLVQYLENRKED